jgi:hypothetical protein
MQVIPRRIPGALALAIGVAIGWGLDHIPNAQSVVRAHGGDRWGDSILTTGPVLVRYNEGTKVQLALDAIYYLDYKAGRLLATVPAFQQSFGPAKMLDNFAERDLVADFKLDADNGPRPHFLMTTGALGTYNEGWSPLYVFESTTNQVAIYKVQQQTVGATSQPKFELVEIRSIGRTTPAAASR